MLENKIQKLLVMTVIILPILFNYSVNRLVSVQDGIMCGSLVLLGGEFIPKKAMTSLLIYHRCTLIIAVLGLLWRPHSLKLQYCFSRPYI